MSRVADVISMLLGMGFVQNGICPAGAIRSCSLPDTTYVATRSRILCSSLLAPPPAVHRPTSTCRPTYVARGM